MSKRKILGITAIRSEYFLQRPIFRAIEDHPDLDLEIIVTGAHLSSLHGHTIKDVERDGFNISDRIDSLIQSDHDADRLKGAANQLQRLVEIVDRKRPDWLLAPADREESMTMALCGAYLGLPIAHYGAGDRVVGNVDDMVRHAVSRLSHLLMTTHEDARQRLIRAGEEEWRVHNVGHSGIDRLRSTVQLTSEDLAEQLGVKSIREPYLMVIQHPLSSEIEFAGQQMRETLAAITELNLQTFVSYPNSDPGSKQIIEVIEENSQKPNLHTFKNIPDVLFVNLLRGAAALIGNSSLGLLEAPYLKLPVINVGKRQTARQHTTNVFFVPHYRQRIVNQVKAILDDEETRRLIARAENIFGEGNAGEKVAELLASQALDDKFLNKDLSY